MSKFFVDSGVAAALVVALLAVIGVDKLVAPASSSSASQSSGVKIDEPVVQVAQTSVARPLRIAVTRTYEGYIKGTNGKEELEKWDDMPKLLDTLGAGYKYTIIEVDDLFNSKTLAAYDVLFFTCGQGGSDTDITRNLYEFVVNGGTLYASDWRYNAVALAFPKFRARELEKDGPAGDLTADVIDPGLRDVLGSKVPLKFNLSMWKAAAFGKARLSPEEQQNFKIMMEGHYKPLRDREITAPLLVKFQVGKGTVIFTSFHNEKQNNAVEQKLLKYLVFSAVTARTEAQVAQTMIKGGFSPQKSNLLSASPESPSITKVYQNKKAGHLRFVLGFENRGARLKLTVVSPSGKQAEQAGTSTITMDFNNAAVGDWQYTVTAERVPYPDFPFTLTVGEAAAKK